MPPLGALVPAPQHAKPARKSARCGVGDGSPRPHLLHPEPVGSGPRRHVRKDRRSGVGERPTPDAPHPGKRCPTRPPSSRPPSAQKPLARARAVGLVTGPHAGNPRTHSQWVVDPGRTPQRTRGRAWESARPRTPHTQARGAPPGPHTQPSRAAPTACKASTQKQACPQGGARPQARQGDKRTRPPPNELKSLSTGPRQETQRGTNRWERPYRRPAPEPRVVRAPHRPGGGGGGANAAGAGAHTHPTDTRART